MERDTSLDFLLKKTLLLDSSYQIESFISFRKAINLLFRDDTVEIISSWEEDISLVSGKIRHPSILRLKNHIRKTISVNAEFSRKTLVYRDKSTCQYCNKVLVGGEVTIDHIIPKYHGGKTSYTNCVVSCKICNNRKSNKTLEQAKLKLLREPIQPAYIPNHKLSRPQEFWNLDWDNFISK
jgi:5-methylcytosine-specific restriction endonuclease McrA